MVGQDRHHTKQSRDGLREHDSVQSGTQEIDIRQNCMSSASKTINNTRAAMTLSRWLYETYIFTMCLFLPCLFLPTRRLTSQVVDLVWGLLPLLTANQSSGNRTAESVLTGTGGMGSAEQCLCSLYKATKVAFHARLSCVFRCAAAIGSLAEHYVGSPPASPWDKPGRAATRRLTESCNRYIVPLIGPPGRERWRGRPN